MKNWPSRPAEPVRAALYCRASRYGDAESQYSLAWMLSHDRGIARNDAEAAHLFAAAAEQGIAQAERMLAAMGGTPMGEPPPCLRPPEADVLPPKPVMAAQKPGAKGQALVRLQDWPAMPPPAQAPAAIVDFVQQVAPEYRLAPALVLAVMATESNFDPAALSPKNAQGLMQLMPDTARRFKVSRLTDPTQNIRGGMAYLRWLLAYFEGDVAWPWPATTPASGRWSVTAACRRTRKLGLMFAGSSASSAGVVFIPLTPRPRQRRRSCRSCARGRRSVWPCR